MHLESVYWLVNLVKSLENYGNRLRAVPFSRLSIYLVSLISNVVNWKRTKLTVNIVLEPMKAHYKEHMSLQSQQTKILLFVFLVILKIVELEAVVKDVPLQSLKKQHLTCSQHTPPTWITCKRGTFKRDFQVWSVSYPSHCLQSVIKFTLNQESLLLIGSISEVESLMKQVHYLSFGILMIELALILC